MQPETIMFQAVFNVNSYGGVEFVAGHYLYSDKDGIVVSPEPLHAA